MTDQASSIANSSGGGETPFRFLDLPTEIRNMIYSHLLVRPRNHYQIIVRKSRHGVRAHYIDRLSLPDNQGLTHHYVGSSAREIPDVAIFFVFRQTHAEASSIFYSQNESRFSRYPTLMYFSEQIASYRQWVRYVYTSWMVDDEKPPVEWRSESSDSDST